MKKFYRQVRYEPSGKGYAILLDGLPARTPLGQPMVLPNPQLAGAVAMEWQAQKESIRKETMPLTQIACVAIDLAGPRSDDVISDLLPFADTDLVCYRAGDVPALNSRQEALLSPILAWAEDRFGLAFFITGGVMPVAQPHANKSKLAALLLGYDTLKLAALASAAKSMGSLLLALALVERRIDAPTAFRLAHLEEEYETEQWGKDDEKEARLHKLKEEVIAVGKFLSLLR